jgi:hypothetical protein
MKKQFNISEDLTKQGTILKSRNLGEQETEIFKSIWTQGRTQKLLPSSPTKHQALDAQHHGYDSVVETCNVLTKICS